MGQHVNELFRAAYRSCARGKSLPNQTGQQRHFAGRRRPYRQQIPPGRQTLAADGGGADVLRGADTRRADTLL